MIKYILFGIVQGLTEFLPVSSSGHLYLLGQINNIRETALPFFVLLHLATLLAIVLFFRREFLLILFNRRLLVYIGVAALITVFAGALVHRNQKLFDAVFGMSFFIPFCLFMNGIILLTSKSNKNLKPYKDMGFKDALLLGILQSIAILPGISRSGITITGLRKCGFRDKDAFLISFAVAVPAVSGAFIIKFRELLNPDLSFYKMGIGFVAALISGLIALRILRKALVNKFFNYFGYYCIALSLFILLFNRV